MMADLGGGAPAPQRGIGAAATTGAGIVAAGARKILIVDDEASLARAIARLLSQMGYETAVAGTVQEAVAVLGAEKISLILLDLQLAGASGMSLLQGLKKRKVPIPVVIISGTGDMDVAITAFRSGAADYLRKPFSLDDVTACVDRVLDATATPVTHAGPAPEPPPDPRREGPGYRAERSSTRTETSSGGRRTDSMLTRPDGLQARVTRAASSLPLLDPRLARLKSAVEQHGSVDDVVRIVQRDVALATAVLRASRSSFYGVREPPATLRDACVTLGNKRVFSIAFELLVRNQFTVRQARYRPVFNGMWRNALVSGRIATRLAALKAGVDGDELHLATFLHNIGELILLQYLAEHHDPADQAPLDLEALEAEALAVHEEVGATATQNWKLAPLLVRLAGYHHRPARTPEPAAQATERQIVLAAWTLAQTAGFRYFPSHEDATADGLLALLDIDPEEVEPLLGQAQQWVDAD